MYSVKKELKTLEHHDINGETKRSSRNVILEN